MTWLQWTIVVVGGTLFILFLSKYAGAAECSSSASEVWSHGARHATWVARGGSKCWFAGYPNRRARVGVEALPRLGGHVSHTGMVPIPRPRELTRTESDTIWSEFQWWELTNEDAFAKAGK